MKTTLTRIYPEDLRDLTRLRLQLSILKGRDVSAADAMRWLLSLDEAQRVISQADVEEYRRRRDERT